jgi:hypothetical protein
LLILLLLWQSSSMAGGWAVVTVEHLPVEATVGEPLLVTFVVRQHGQHPVHLNATLEANHVASGETLTFEATPLAEEGRHTAEITLSRPGVWRWQIIAHPFPSESGWLTLHVLPVDGENAPPVKAQLDSGARRIQALVALFLKFLQGDIQPVQSVADRAASLQAASLQNEATREITVDEWTLGKILFVGKGCASCHMHNDVAGWSTQIGRDLSDYHRDGDFLRHWLRNSGTATASLAWGMPTLELEDSEIEALIAFLVPGRR